MAENTLAQSLAATEQEETPEQKARRLAAEERAKRIQGYIPTPAPGALPTSQQYVEQMQKLAADPTYIPSDATPEERKSLQSILDAAQTQFEEAQNRAEWQDVAQTLGKALVQFTAATRGGSKQDLSNIAQPTVDYGARINAAQQTLAGRQKTALSKFELDKQAKSEEAEQRANEYKSISDALEAGRRTAAEREKDQASLDRALKLEQERARREAEEAKKNPPKADYTPVKLQLEELNKQEDQLSKQIQAAQQLFNDQEVSDDLSRKSSSELQKKYGQLAATAGIDLPTLKSKLDATDTPGRVWGKNKNEEARQQVLQNELKPKLNFLNEIQKQKKAILSGVSTEQVIPPTTPQSKSQEPVGPTEEQVKQYAAQYKLPEDKARAILVKRMTGGK